MTPRYTPPRNTDTPWTFRMYCFDRGDLVTVTRTELEVYELVRDHEDQCEFVHELTYWNANSDDFRNLLLLIRTMYEIPEYRVPYYLDDTGTDSDEE